jgi:hypothetical protein
MSIRSVVSFSKAFFCHLMFDIVFLSICHSYVTILITPVVHLNYRYTIDARHAPQSHSCKRLITRIKVKEKTKQPPMCTVSGPSRHQRSNVSRLSIFRPKKESTEPLAAGRRYPCLQGFKYPFDLKNRSATVSLKFANFVNISQNLI